MLDVPSEGLRRELQPFHHCQIGEELASKVMDCHVCANSQRCGLDQLSGLRGNCLHSEKPARFRVRNQLDEPARIEIG